MPASLPQNARAVTRSWAHIFVDSHPNQTYLPAMTWDAELDATGLLCPLPVLKARKRLQALHPGQVLRMLADDPAAIIDVPHFCAEAGHQLISSEDTPAGQIYLIAKA